MSRALATSVYVHAPFCARRCLYCDFAVTVRSTGDLAGWRDALSLELRAVERDDLFELPDSFDTVYVGGGTPSLMGPSAMASIRELLGPHRLTNPDLEWTSEANPESFDGEIARGWIAAGVNRLSLGVQSFDPGTLRWMGRLHGPEGARQAVRVSQDAGLVNVSVDLMFGVPDHLERDWRADLDEAVRLDAPHISLYGLTVEPATALGRRVREGTERPVDDQRYRDEYLLASEVLTAAGYEHYEVSNFARPGARARHNAVYWIGTPYLGLGSGAHSYAPPIRKWNIRDFDGYVADLEQGGCGEGGREEVTGDAARMEDAWLGLRTSEGVSIPAGSVAADLAERWRRSGYASYERDRLKLTPEGWLLLDELAVELELALTQE